MMERFNASLSTIVRHSVDVFDHWTNPIMMGPGNLSPGKHAVSGQYTPEQSDDQPIHM